MKPHSYIASGLIAAALGSCENPADKTATATVTEAQADTNPAHSHGEEEDPLYSLTEASTVSFVGSKVTGSHEGGFKEIDGHLHISDSDEVTGGTIHIDMNSTWSDNDKLTEHLKAADFFDVANHPKATFYLTRVKKESDGKYQISGDLDLRGVEKNITFPATAAKDGEDIKVQAEFDINRKDWGIEYAGKKDDLIRDEVVLKLDLVITPHSGEHSH